MIQRISYLSVIYTFYIYQRQNFSIRFVKEFLSIARNPRKNLRDRFLQRIKQF